MATVLAVYNSEGCVGRCDGKCHQAASGLCNCICSGLNHGVGYHRAAANTREYAEEWVKEYASETRIGRIDLVECLGVLSTPDAIVIPEPGQRTLKNPRHLTAMQRGALETADNCGIVRAGEYTKRTIQSLQKRGLLMPYSPSDNDSVITPTGRALLVTIESKIPYIDSEIPF